MESDFSSSPPFNPHGDRDNNPDSIFFNEIEQVTSHMEHHSLLFPTEELEFSPSLSEFGMIPFRDGPFDRLSGEEYARCSKEMEGHSINQGDPEVQRLSTEDIMRLAAERFIHSSAERGDNSSSSIYSMHPHGSVLSDLSMEDLKDVELAQLLLSTAEKISSHQYDAASKLLSRCELMASSSGNPVERVVFYFAEALREKIDKQLGRKSAASENADRKIVAYEQSMASGSSLEFIALHQGLPIMQACQFAGMQAILDKIVLSKKVHIIDLQLRSGIHWTILMQALASRKDPPIKLLKLTTVGTINKQAIEGTCERLASFAESLKLPFCFEVVFVSDLKEITTDQFKVEFDETVVVYSQSALMLMLSKPSYLDNLMVTISRLRPVLMVIIELEAKHNSPSFVKRFTDTLFFHSAYFDCFETCLERDNKYRMMLEGMYFREGIRNIMAMAGEERIKRGVTIDVWRKFFARFRMVENEISELAMNYAKMVVKLFECESSCTIDQNGKSLVIGWKGTPLHSLSIWRFC